MADPTLNFPNAQWPYERVLMRLGLALCIGLLVGLERERRAKEMGMRPFAFAALLGCLGALLGPAQVAARVLEAAFGRRHHPVWTLVISTVAVSAGLGMLVGDSAMIAAGLILYGAGSGIRSIARGTVPLALFGREGYAALMGRLAAPTLVAQAASPAIGTVLMEQFGASGTMGALCAAAVINIALSAALLAAGPRH